MALYALDGKTPEVPASAFVAAEATLIGAVILGEHVSVWPGAVIRGDNEPITIGASSNIQEGAVLHADPGFPLSIGERVTVGHQAMLHGCTIGAGTLIGIKAVVLNGAVVGEHCLVGAAALITEKKAIAARSLVVGAPGAVKRELSAAEIANLEAAAEGYVQRALRFKTALTRID